MVHQCTCAHSSHSSVFTKRKTAVLHGTILGPKLWRGLDIRCQALPSARRQRQRIPPKVVVPSLRCTRGPGPCAALTHWTKLSFHFTIILLRGSAGTPELQSLISFPPLPAQAPAVLSLKPLAVVPHLFTMGSPQILPHWQLSHSISRRCSSGAEKGTVGRTREEDASRQVELGKGRLARPRMR